MFQNIGFTEILLIAVVALILFGPQKLPELGRTLGRAIFEFKKGTRELLGDAPATPPTPTAAQTAPQAPAAAPTAAATMEAAVNEAAAAQPAAPAAAPSNPRRLPD